MREIFDVTERVTGRVTFAKFEFFPNSILSVDDSELLQLDHDYSLLLLLILDASSCMLNVRVNF
jgi:hypothetical protein